MEVVILIIVQTALIIMLAATVLMLRRKAAVGARPAVGAQPAAAVAVAAPRAELGPEEMERLRQSTQEVFTKAVNEAATTFHSDLQATSQQLNKLIVRLTTDVVERELEAYRSGLAAARQEAVTSLQGMRQVVEQTQKDPQSDVNAELQARQQQLVERLDKRLGEAAAAYIVESLGQGADLGAQRAFMLESLERHKDDLKREVSGG